jgi:disulfide bond formation protein DsbB
MTDVSRRSDARSAPNPFEGVALGLLHIEILGVLGVIGGAFWYQFVKGELPCPLCLLQRMGMVLAMLGPAYVLIRRHRDDDTVTPVDRVATGFGMSILGGMLGMAMATRQVLLHILPGDPGYGDAVMGMHLYTWAVVVFVVVIVTSGVTLLFHRQLAPDRSDQPMPWWTKATLWLLGLMILANMLNAFAIAGFHAFLPDNPIEYLLFGMTPGGE